MRSSIVLVALLLMSFSFLTETRAQGGCTVNGVAFDCPPNKYFREIKTEKEGVRIFKYLAHGQGMYVFMTVPDGTFQPSLVAELVYRNQAGSVNPTFEWTKEVAPLLMDFETKYKPEVTAWLGLRTMRLIEVKAFEFEVNGKRLVLGYLSDWSEGDKSNSRRFKAAEAVGDNAEGCNMVMTLLNSVTKEFKDKDQGCTLMVQLSK